MQFTREINRVLIFLLVMFAVIALVAGYWAALGADTILERDDNPRLVLDALSVLRGDIVDREGELLATSVATAEGLATRVYPEIATYSAVGYYSYRYGVNGAEAAYDALLSGSDGAEPTLLDHLNEDLLHLPRHGTDLRLTLSLDVQQTIVTQMGDYAGAAVVVGVPTGEIMALVSLPTFDPNVLDANWETFVAAPGNLFFNRALQGGYQPGGTLQTPLLAASMNPGGSFPIRYEQADATVSVNGLTLNCLSQPPQTTLTLSEAYLYGCPMPFVTFAEALGMPMLQQVLERFRLTPPPTLEGFVVAPPNPEGTPQSLDSALDATPEITVGSAEDVLGQGVMTVNPLAMALISAAVINEGNAPMPVTLLATRPEDSTGWLPVRDGQATFGAMMTADTARGLREVMERNVREGTAQAAQQTDLRIGGHVALAFAGSSTQVWFIGFVLFEDGRGAAIALVLEDTADTALAARIGGQALAAAYVALQSEVTP